MSPFYGWGSTALRLEPLQGGNLLFTTKFPESLDIWSWTRCKILVGILLGPRDLLMLRDDITL